MIWQHDIAQPLQGAEEVDADYVFPAGLSLAQWICFPEMQLKSASFISEDMLEIKAWLSNLVHWDDLGTKGLSQTVLFWAVKWPICQERRLELTGLGTAGARIGAHGTCLYWEVENDEVGSEIVGSSCVHPQS